MREILLFFEIPPKSFIFVKISKLKIVLLGYMGSGKSTVGKHLAALLNLQFLDLDDYLEKAEGISIPTIFKNRGELYFRKKEHHYLKEICTEKDDFILSAGGGTPCYGTNLETILMTTENVFYLKVSIPELVNRLSKEKSERPLIKNIPDEDLPEFIGKHLFERNQYYTQAKHTIVCDLKEPSEIAVEIESLLG